jgi:hypothetical protein
MREFHQPLDTIQQRFYHEWNELVSLHRKLSTEQ